ncbi:hypothetical protein HZB88_01555 [archaeon]|nr:hypothetical protein [archaeon]
MKQRGIMQLYSFIALILAVLFIAGCGETVTSGDKAVIAKFVEGVPTSSEIDTSAPGEEIDVDIELTNMLPEEIESGNVKVKLTGDAGISSIFEGAKEAVNPLLEGYNYDTNVGSPEEIELGPIKYIGEISTKISKDITAKYCYQVPITLRGTLYYTANEDEIGANYVTDVTHPSSLTIIDIEQDVVKVGDDSGTLRIKITIQNTGTGTVIDSFDECFKYRKKSEREQLKMEAKAAYDIECENEGYARLSRTDRSKIMDCTISNIDTTNLGPQPSELTITLSEFAYEDTIEPVTIWMEP